MVRATPSKKSATPSLRLPPHHLTPFTGRPRVMKPPARAKECKHKQKVPSKARNGHKTDHIKEEASKDVVSVAKNGAPRRASAPLAHKCAPREGVLALLVLWTLAPRDAPPARKRTPKASGSTYKMFWPIKCYLKLVERPSPGGTPCSPAWRARRECS